MHEAVPDLVPDRPATVSRRVAMAGGLAAVAGMAAACTVGGSDPNSASDGPVTRAGSSGAAGGASGPPGSSDASASSGRSGSGSSGSDSSGSGTSGIVALAEVPVGEAVAVTIDGAPAVVARPQDRTVAAFSARCTHMGCTVLVAGTTLRCPCHGSQFDAMTGAVLGGPATVDLPAIAVHLDGDEVVAG
jgi:Rieske Fe-S protein